jgi:5'-deoxynucleotidase YfbR-like HD superfamily hydrolase
LELFKEEQSKKTPEARLVKDADTLEWIVTLRGEEVKGNTKAIKWINIAMKRLKTDSAKKLGEILLKTNPDSWWFDAKDEWFVDRKEEHKKWGSKENK